MEEQIGGLERIRVDLCKHHRVVRIAPEPGFETACAIGYRASPKCHAERISECQGYQSDCAITVMTNTPGPAIRKGPSFRVNLGAVQLGLGGA